jgi:hypothetical protein
MNRLALKVSFSRARNCHHLITTSRGRRDALAKGLDKKWSELRRHASIERDAALLARLRLAAKLDEYGRQQEVADKHRDSC